MQCPNCSKEIRDTAKVCGYCGNRLQITPAKCPECGNEKREGAKVCGYCGYKFEEAQPAPEIESAQPLVEEKPEHHPKDVGETKKQPAPSLEPETVSEFGEAPPEQMESKPKVQPKQGPTSTEAGPDETIEAKIATPGKRLPAWVRVTVLLMLVIGGAVITQTQGWLLPRESFAGAIGEWEAHDGGDGSYQTLSIRRTITGTYKLNFVDEMATSCNGKPARATFYGTTSTAILSTKMEYYCGTNSGKPQGSVVVKLIYNAAQGKITDSWGDVWTRQNK